MDYPKHLFKSPGSFGSGDRTYDVAGSESEDQEAALIEMGWFASKEDAWAVTDEKPATADMKELRSEYQELAGKRAFPGWGEAKLRELLAELKKG